MLHLVGFRRLSGRDPLALTAVCPVCGEIGLLLNPPDGRVDWSVDAETHFQDTTPAAAGVRVCPGVSCKALFLVAYDPASGRILATFPRRRIGFDRTNIPPRVARFLQEAVHCHAAGCHPAAAMMVRKTLEALCTDQDLRGLDLQERLQGLKTRAALPGEVQEHLGEVRLLAPAAAEVDASFYEDVGPQEADALIAFAKDLLGAVYRPRELTETMAALLAAGGEGLEKYFRHP